MDKVDDIFSRIRGPKQTPYKRRWHFPARLTEKGKTRENNTEEKGIWGNWRKGVQGKKGMKMEGWGKGRTPLISEHEHAYAYNHL